MLFEWMNVEDRLRGQVRVLNATVNEEKGYAAIGRREGTQRRCERQEELA